MKTNATAQPSFLFYPELSVTNRLTATRPVRLPRRQTLSLVSETQIDYKQEFICGIILILCLLFGLTVSMAQFTLA